MLQHTTIESAGTLVPSVTETFTHFAGMQEMICITDTHEKVLYVNKSYVIFTGYTLQALQHTDRTLLIHPHDIPQAIDQYTELVNSRLPFALEYRFRNDAGEYRWVSTFGIPRFSDEGEFKGYVSITTDIHARKEAEENNYLQVQAMNNVSDAIISTDLQFNVTVFNKVAERVYGIRAADIIGKPIRELIDHKYPDSTREEALKELYLYDRWAGLCYFDRADGHRVFLHCSLAFIKDHEGNRIGMAGIHRDITNLQEVESVTRRQDQLLLLEKQMLEMNALPGLALKTIIDNFLEGLESFFPGMYCSVLVMNDEKESLKHLSAPSLPAEYTNYINFIKPGPKVGSCGTAIYRKERVITTDILKDPLWDDYSGMATEFDLRSCWSFPIVNAQKEVLATLAAYHKFPKAPTEEELKVLERVCSLLRVIIENKNAEARIRISHERYLLVTRVTNDAVWDWDIANSDHVHYGDGFYALFGYNTGYVQQSIGFWESCIHPEERERVVTRLEQFTKGNTSRIWEDEYRFKKANGEYALVHDRGFLIFDHGGKITRMIGSMQDITEKKELEKKLLRQELDRQKQMAEAVINAQEKERADIGKDLHDNVNQILTTAKLYIEMARHEESKAEELLKRSADNISEAINEIRSLSRSLVPASIGDLGLVVSIQDLVENINATGQLVVAFDYEGAIDETIDEKRKLVLFRIIQEQVSNVLKHAAASTLEITLTLDEHVIELCIKDDGKGFDPEKVRVNKGVGLSNITSRAELFSGKVDIAAAPGKGCQLKIIIPI